MPSLTLKKDPVLREIIENLITALEQLKVETAALRARAGQMDASELAEGGTD